MIGRGKYRDFYLYEVTEQDLCFSPQRNAHYRRGNVLLFTSKRAIDFGSEFACAEDLPSAREFLNQKVRTDNQSQEMLTQALSDVSAQLARKDEQVQELGTLLEQRDELLRDLAVNMDVQRQDNELLHAQLLKAREQLAADELKHNELIDDLQFASSETHTIESTLEQVMEDKYRLEQELAEHITDLVELNLQNDDLRRQLQEPAGQNHAAPVTVSPPQGSPTPQPISTEPDIRVFTMPSGKQIHILHEFPPTPERNFLQRFARASLALLRSCAVVLIILFVVGAVSVFATAQVNSISYGDAFDLIVRSFGLPRLLS